MLTLVLAAPRTGKSQLMVQKLSAHKAEGKLVFVTNFKQTPEQRVESGFQVYGDAPDWDGLKEDVWRGDVSGWMEQLPPGSVWMVDEAQDVFPQRGKSTALPEFVKLFSKHGHRDLTIYIVTQDAMQLDVHLRRNSNLTLYMTRPLNLRRAVIYTFRGYQEIPNDAWRRSQVLKAAESKVKFRYRKKWQRLYVSASGHDHIKKRIPFRLLLLPLMVCLVVWLLWFSYSRLTGGKSVKDVAKSASPAALVAGALTSSDDAVAQSGPVQSVVMNADQWAAQFQPRYRDVPWSAPAYDGFEVQDYPRLYCVISGEPGADRCRCYSQQATRIDVSDQACRLYVLNGVFDPYRKPQQAFSQQVRASEEGDASERPAALSVVIPAATASVASDSPSQSVAPP